MLIFIPHTSHLTPHTSHQSNPTYPILKHFHLHFDQSLKIKADFPTTVQIDVKLHLTIYTDRYKLTARTNWYKIQIALIFD